MSEEEVKFLYEKFKKISSSKEDDGLIDFEYLELSSSALIPPLESSEQP